MLWEEDSPESGDFHAESIILHKFGHCAMALDHPDRNWDADNDGVFENTSFTRSTNAGVPGGISAGPDGIRGSYDDQQVAPDETPADSVSWFRRSDNDPFVADSTVIDINTYSRSTTANLPPGHSWAANGNRLVATSPPLSYPFTQAVMYSLAAENMQYSGLSADDVNMVRMGMTGVDLMANTADDYTIQLVFVPDCASSPSAIRVTFGTLTEGTVGACESIDIDYSFPPENPFLARHYSLVELIHTFPPFVRLNSALTWDTGPPLPPIVFQDGFESGDFSAWGVVPLTGDA